MIVLQITFPLVILALFVTALLIPFAYAALVLEDACRMLRKLNLPLTLLVTTLGAILWLETLWQLALYLAPCWCTFLGL